MVVGLVWKRARPEPSAWTEVAGCNPRVRAQAANGEVVVHGRWPGAKDEARGTWDC